MKTDDSPAKHICCSINVSELRFVDLRDSCTRMFVAIVNSQSDAKCPKSSQAKSCKVTETRQSQVSLAPSPPHQLIIIVPYENIE